MKIRLIAVGKLKEAFFRDAVAEYEKRLGRYADLEIVEIEDEKTKEDASPRENALVLEREGARMLKRISDREHVVALSIDGQAFDSEALSMRVEALQSTGKTVDFLIGGSLGLSKEVLQRADERWSFSKLTFPHQLMRVIFLEQLYRGFKILKHEPYHK